MSRRLHRLLQPYRRRPETQTVARRAAMPGPLVLDLVASLVESGAPPSAALHETGSTLADIGDPRGRKLLLLGDLVPDTPPGQDRDSRDSTVAALVEALALAARSGLPPSALVRRAATEERRRQAAARGKAIHRLEVMLVIPGAVCLLPAFALLGIVPLVIRLTSG